MSAQTLTELFNFTGTSGALPNGAMAITSTHNLVGATNAGGSANFGVVYICSPLSQSVEVLHNFAGGDTDGANPQGRVVLDASGSIYGTTSGGGPAGAGSVWKMTPPVNGSSSWTFSILYFFNGGNDGADPIAGLMFGNGGVLFGTTNGGGATGDGTVFELNPPATTGDPWTEQVIYAFSGTDGSQPHSDLSMDANGVLYGTTKFGGASNKGTAYSLTPPTAGGAWTEAVLHSFTGRTFHAGDSEGSYPYGGLFVGSAGVLYGTTSKGSVNPFDGAGTFYSLTPPAAAGGAWTINHLLDFEGGFNPEYPEFPIADLVQDSSGNLWTSADGGSLSEGTIVELVAPTGTNGWTANVAATFFGPSFSPPANGSFPHAGLVQDSTGAFFGVTEQGGEYCVQYETYGCGTIFELMP